MSLSGKRLLVCGGAGFLGRNLVEYLAQRYPGFVTATCRGCPPSTYDGVDWIDADLRDAEQVASVVQGVDVIFQCAATSSGAKDILATPYMHVTDNVIINSLIFRAAHEAGVSQCFFPSCSVMYNSSDTALAEDDFDANSEMYPAYFGAGWTKVYLEKMARFFSGLGVTRYTVLRHSNLYGPYDKFDLEKSHVLAATVTKVLLAQDEIVVWGAGHEQRDFLYIDDMVAAIVTAMERQDEAYDLFTVGSGQAVSVSDVARMIVRLSGKRLTVRHDLEKRSLDTRVYLDAGRFTARYGWSPAVSLEDGLIRTLSWARQTLDIGTNDE